MEELTTAHPQAKVIVTVRDVDVWYRSHDHDPKMSNAAMFESLLAPFLQRTLALRLAHVVLLVSAVALALGCDLYGRRK